MYWERPRHRANRSAFNSRLSQNVQYRGATDANLARHVSGRSSRLVQLHHALADTPGRTTVLDDGPANGSSGRWTKFNGGVGGIAPGPRKDPDAACRCRPAAALDQLSDH